MHNSGSSALTDIDIKLKRADKHLRDLDRRIVQWIKGKRGHIVDKHDTDTGWHHIRVEGIPDPPDDWVAVLGDLGYNLRAALEYLIEGLVLANNETPNRNNQFPVIGKIEDAHGLAEMLRGIDLQAVAVIEDLQPYNRPNRTEPDLLESLVVLANIDKHHRLHAAVMSSKPYGLQSFRITIPDGAVVNRIGAGAVGPISDTDLLSLRSVPPEAAIDVKMKTNPTLTVAFSNGAPLPLPRIYDLIDEVRRIVDLLKPWLSGP